MRAGRIQSSQGATTAMNSPGTATPLMKPRMPRKTSEIGSEAKVGEAGHRVYSTSRIISISTGIPIGQFGHAHRRPRVLADGLAEDLDHQVRKAVDDLGLIAEAFGRVDHTEDFDHAFDLVKAAERDLGGGEETQADLARDLIALLDGQVFAELPARGGHPALPQGAVPREKEQIASADRAHVVRHRCGRLGEHDVSLFQASFRAHARRASSGSGDSRGVIVAH